MDEVRAELAALRNRIAVLESQITGAPEPGQAGDTPTRRGLLAGAVAAMAGGAALAAASPAKAANGQPLVLGSAANTATLPTGMAFTGSVVGQGYGIGITDQGLNAFAESAAIAGHTRGNFTNGILGYDTGTRTSTAGVTGYTNIGYGIYGAALGTTGSSTGATGIGYRRGVWGAARGSSPNSIGVLAENVEGGTALAVRGVLRATRAGRIVIPAGQKRRTVALSRLTPTSLALATAQKLAGSIAVAAVTVKITAPPSLTIWLNAAAPAGGMPVAGFVVDTIGTALSAAPVEVDPAAAEAYSSRGKETLPD